MNRMDTSQPAPPANPPPLSPDPSPGATVRPPETDIPIPGSTRPPAKVIILAGVGIVAALLAAVGGYGYWQVQEAKTWMQGAIQSQVADLDRIDASYSAIQNILAEPLPTSDQDATTTNLLKAIPPKKTVPRRLKDVEPQVLGAEDELQITLNRRLAEQYKKSRTAIKAIQKRNAEITTKMTEWNMIRSFLPDIRPLLAKTDTVAQMAEAMLAYLNETNTIEIEGKTLGYQIGLAMREAILRDADDASVAKLREKIRELETFYGKAERMSTDNLPQVLKENHAESLATFDRDMEVFRDLLRGFEEKDIFMIQEALESMVIQSASQTTKAEILMRSFWQNDEAISAMEELRDDWQTFGEQELTMSF